MEVARVLDQRDIIAEPDELARSNAGGLIEAQEQRRHDGIEQEYGLDREKRQDEEIRCERVGQVARACWLYAHERRFSLHLRYPQTIRACVWACTCNPRVAAEGVG